MTLDREARPRVLVIDDDVVIRITIQACLEEAGFEVVEAGCGVDGLRCFEASPADIVLLDVMMPDMDGFSVCRALRDSRRGAHVPVLMITGNDDLESVNRAFEAGATDFTTKPINSRLLAHRVQYMLRAKQTADALRDREARLAHAQRIARLGDWELDPVSRRLECSATMMDICSLDNGDIGWDELLDRVHDQDRGRVDDALRQALKSMTPFALEYRLVAADGDTLTVYQNSEIVPGEDDGPARVFGTLQDISQRRAAESRIRELAYYDSVTALPNRTFLNEQLESCLAAARADGSVVGLLFIDLDDFKHVNDTWGHSVGDELLNAVGLRLTNSLRGRDAPGRASGAGDPGLPTVARLGGDEFVILLAGLRTPADAERIAERVNNVFREPYVVRDTEVYLGGSIGISVFPDDATDAESLLRNADGAMYEAKSAGRNLHRFYSSEIRERAFTRLNVEAHMRRGIEREEFELHFQPKIDLKNDRLVGMEALLRWNSAELGTVSPVEFIPVAEATGLIVPLGEWVLDRACEQTRRWLDDGLGPLSVSVNLSMAQFARDNLTRVVADTLARHGLDPARLELELTESLLMNNTGSTLSTVHALKEIGVALSIDDFGTGFSSLSYLKRLPVDRLKIDRCFVNDMERDADDAAIVRGTIALAHSLRLNVVAEGVENSGQLQLLEALHCDEVQGYHYSRPLDPIAFETWTRQRRCLAEGGRGLAPGSLKRAG